MTDPLVAAAIRLLHVLAMAVAVGGPLAVGFLLKPGWPGGRRLLSFERALWVALGLIVLTGIGNMGALGEAFPDLRTTRGAAFAAKFGLVLVLLAVSAVRTLLVARLEAHEAQQGPAATARLARVYVASSALGGVIAGLGVLLAHGGL